VKFLIKWVNFYLKAKKQFLKSTQDGGLVQSVNFLFYFFISRKPIPMSQFQK